MIISHTKKFIFFAVPKTGTHSVRQALRPHLTQDDLEQVGLFVHKRLPFPELSALGHGHLSAAQVLPVLGSPLFMEYFKFAFVRNPYDRFVSFCSFMSRNTERFATEPNAVMNEVLNDVKLHQHILFRPQNELLCDSAGDLLMDFVGKVEFMQRDFDTICARLDLPLAKLEQVNQSIHRPYQEYYDSELRERVAATYLRDFELFNYRFGAATD
ncbi:MAG: sulfotransferase family 2 domain-containing protein [Tahibacter sp.]